MAGCSLLATLQKMIELRKTDTYSKWIDALQDLKARARILVRIERLAAGNPGDVKAVGEGVSELRMGFWAGVSRLLHAAWQRNHHSAGGWRQRFTSQGHRQSQETGEKFVASR